MVKIKLFAVAVFLVLTAIALSNSRHFATSANGDVLQEIAKYKTWQRINKEPIKVASGFQIDGKSGDEQVFIVDGQEVTNFRTGELSGWNNLPFELLSSGSNQKDLVGIFTDFGRQIKKLFPKKREKQKQSETNSAEIKTLPKDVKFSEPLKVAPNAAAHEFSFGVVYANDLAKAEIEKENPNFPLGSIIVREKNASETSATPEIVIAMVKRENGFSKGTNDWEFFVFNGADLKMQRRETKGDCATCHSRAEKNDWVFRDYLK